MRLLTIILFLFGLPLLTGGVWLLSLGGSWYYTLAGATLNSTPSLLSAIPALARNWT